MTEGITLLCTLSTETMEKIEKIVLQCNKSKGGWQRKVNRQAIIRALVDHALKQNLQYESRYSKEVVIRVVRKSI